MKYIKAGNKILAKEIVNEQVNKMDYFLENCFIYGVVFFLLYFFINWIKIRWIMGSDLVILLAWILLTIIISNIILKVLKKMGRISLKK